MDENTEPKFIFTGYRSTALEVGITTAVCALILLSLSPGLAGLVDPPAAAGFLAVGVVLGGVLYWALQHYLLQDRALSLSDGKIVQSTLLARGPDWSKVTVLADFDEVVALYIKPVRSLLHRYQAWSYQIVLLKLDGRELVMANDHQTVEAYQDSLERAQEMAEALGCEVLSLGPETPVSVRLRNNSISLSQKNEDLGLGGRLLALALVLGFIWGLISLAP